MGAHCVYQVYHARYGPARWCREDIEVPDVLGARKGYTTMTQKPKSILIVDDNVDAAESLGELLKVSGHLVHVSFDGTTALETAGSLRPDVVILDIGMPRMNGYEVARSLRSDASLKSTLLVAVTGYAQEKDRARAQESGFDYHFAKPIDIPRLVHILDQSV
jgi:CheY-like chemotaxis protein